MQAKDVMTSSVVTVDANTPVEEVARTLLEWRISAVPVVDAKERMVGMVSEGDLIHRPDSSEQPPGPWWLSAMADSRGGPVDYARVHGRTAADVMTRDVLAVDENATVAEIAQLLEEQRIKRVPVTRHGKIVGIVSRANLLHGLVAAAPSGQNREDDQQVRASVLNVLRNHTDVQIEALNVTVAEGVAHLWGTALSPEQKNAIRVAAENTPGVSEVRDHLTVLPEMFLRWKQNTDRLKTTLV